MSSQAEYWNDAGGVSWVDGQAQLDAQLAQFGALAIDAAAVQSGEVVLDVGCGCGATTEDLASLVGTSGRVVGLDVSAPMLARARERLAGRPVELLLGDAATFALPAHSFDVLFSRFGVMFFEEPLAAFAHLRGALKLGGRVAMVVWQSHVGEPVGDRSHRGGGRHRRTAGARRCGRARALQPLRSRRCTHDAARGGVHRR